MGKIQPLRLRYTKRALRQLFAVLSYIEMHSPQGAANVQRRLHRSIELLKGRPYMGTATTRSGYRRIVLSPYPYIVLYQPTEDEIIIHGVRHAARRSQGG